MMKTDKIQFIAGFSLLIISIVCGKIFLQSNELFYRLLMGMAIGYTLVRGSFGFGGCFNRFFINGSAKLMKAAMWMFFLSATVSAIVVYANPSAFDLRINPISIGTIAGGFLFGCGMAFSRAGASGILPDLAESPSRAGISLLFFCFGFVLGYPLLNSQTWLEVSMISTGANNGVYFPDLFKFDGKNGYLGGLLLTAAICVFVGMLCCLYENKRKNRGTYIPYQAEILQEKARREKHKNMYQKLFASPWQLSTFVVIMAILYGIMLEKTKLGWIAAAAYGTWGMQILALVGVAAGDIAALTGVSESEFLTPFFQNQLSVQNFAIALGAFVAMLTSGRLIAYYKAEWKISFKDFILYAVGGTIMGIGARLANGCNAGALYTPIANMSLSGWVVFACAFLGAFVGNKLKKLYFKNK